MTEPSRTARNWAHWAQKRRVRWLRANPLCAACLMRGISTPATEVDHVIPLFKRGADNESNFQSLCGPCHKAKSAKERGYKAKPLIGVDGWPIDESEGGPPGGRLNP